MFKKQTNETRSAVGSKAGSAYASMLKLDVTIPFFQARDGENQVRLLPILEEEQHMKFGGMEVWTFYSGAGLVVSPSTFGNARDPIMEKYRRYKLTNPGKAKVFKPSKHILNYILSYNEGDDRNKVMIWRTSETFRNNIFGRAKDRKTGTILPIDDPEEGRILFFEKYGQGRDTKYAQEGVDSTPDFIENIDEIGSQMRPFADILFVPSAEELENLAADMEHIPVDDEKEDDVDWGRPANREDPKPNFEKEEPTPEIQKQQDADSEAIAERIRQKLAKGKTSQE